MHKNTWEMVYFLDFTNDAKIQKKLIRLCFLR